MKPRSPLAILLGAAAVAVLALFGLLDLYQSTKLFNQQRPDPYRMGYQEPRFAEVAGMLPLEVTVGYISNLDLTDLKGATAFSGTQYGLAPRRVVPYDDPAAGIFVVGNFTVDVESSEITSRIAREKGMRVVRNFDAGVVLFRKEVRQ